MTTMSLTGSKHFSGGNLRQEEAHITTFPERDANSSPGSSPPASSSPLPGCSPGNFDPHTVVAHTPACISGLRVESGDRSSSGIHDADCGDSHWKEGSQTHKVKYDLDTVLGQTAFAQQLDRLLRAVQRNRAHVATPCLAQPLPSLLCQFKRGDALVSGALGSSHKTNLRKRLRATSVPPPPESRSKATGSSRNMHGSGKNPRKKPRLDNNRTPASIGALTKRRSTIRHVQGLSGAFGLRYAKGAGSLRRAESLRSDLLATDASIAHVQGTVSSSKRKDSRKKNAVNETETIKSSDGLAPTVPTTPTAKALAAKKDGLTDLPIVAPPPFELIPRAPLSSEDAAEARIGRLLERELADRTADGLQVPAKESSSKRLKPARSEDEEERFWMDEGGDNCPDEDGAEEWFAEEEARQCKYREKACERRVVLSSKLPGEPPHRATITSAPVELAVGKTLVEGAIRWILEVLPPDENETSYSPGDLYDILSTLPEVRFHAGYLFLRYASLVSPLDEPSSPTDELSDDAEALEAVVWDVALACLALSVKFHRDVLPPLDVIYADEFLALAFRLGGGNGPGAFAAELWAALPTLRGLFAFDGGWAGVQEEMWTILGGALLDPDVLRYPVSLLTAVALMESVVRCLAKRFNVTGLNHYGRKFKKRDNPSLRKAAMKASKGVRLDIADVMRLADDELVKCEKWLGLAEGLE
ncbi:hypothetical protein C8Q78DRAFT_749412 [Trametes maxima]|nr:hypothetical protein C8Q78DRAFT_749412 [Trametes maxima]